MQRGALEQRFESAMESLISAHREATRYLASSEPAEELLLQALACADEVRRSARRGGAERPSAEDCEMLESVATRIEFVLRQAENAPQIGELARAIESERHDAVAALALETFSGLERIAEAPRYVYRPLSLRERVRGQGETLPTPGVAAERIALAVSAAVPEDRQGSHRGVPQPLVLAPSRESCEGDLALRITTREISARILLHEPSGDLWLFSRKLPAEVAVSAVKDAEDEWWAASPVPYREYIGALGTELTRRGVPFLVEE